MVFAKLHFRIKVIYRDVQRVFALTGMQVGSEQEKVGDLRVVWFG